MSEKQFFYYWILILLSALVIISVALYYRPYESMVTVRHIDILEDDDLFNDVKLYENDIMFKQGDGKLGFEKCIQECTGRCIEFGVTGNGICFPKSEFDYPEDN